MSTAGEAHATLALARVLEQFKNKPNFTAIVEIESARIQALDDATLLIEQVRDPDVAAGAQLDQIGERVGQPREGRDDPEYRLWIKARQLINRSNGQPDDTLLVLQLIEPALVPIITDYYPASYFVHADELVSDPDAVWRILKQVKGAGVRMFLVYGLGEDETTLFRFASGDTTELDDTQGFADDAATTGGRMVDAIG